MKLLIVGEWRWEPYEDAFARGLTHHGIIVDKFSTSPMFEGRWGHVQSALPLPSPARNCINTTLLEAVKTRRPDAVLFWRPTHILPSTVRELSHQGIRSISYNNDDPFFPKNNLRLLSHHRLRWNLYKRCLPFFDLNFFYRAINIQEAVEQGARHADILLPYFLPWKDRPAQLSSEELARYQAQVVFVGHYEEDGRLEFLNQIVAAGFTLRIWGPKEWHTVSIRGMDTRSIVRASGDDYAKALSGADICLAFLSKSNRDTYTRRCFEIPACGKLMLVERTRDLTNLFKENEEAVFFSSARELIDKITWLTENPDIRDEIARGGYKRVWKGRHDVFSRTEQFVSTMKGKGLGV